MSSLPGASILLAPHVMTLRLTTASPFQDRSYASFSRMTFKRNDCRLVTSGHISIMVAVCILNPVVLLCTCAENNQTYPGHLFGDNMRRRTFSQDRHIRPSGQKAAARRKVTSGSSSPGTDFVLPDFPKKTAFPACAAYRTHFAPASIL